MSTQRFLLLASSLVALALAGCGSPRPEGSVSWPELTATAQAVAGPSEVASPTLTAPPATPAVSGSEPTAEPSPSPAVAPSPTAQPLPTPTPPPEPSPTPEPMVWLERSVLRFDEARSVSCAWSPAGTALAVADSTGARLLDPQTLEVQYQLDTGAGITALAYSPDGRFLAVATDSITVQVWDGTGRELLRTFEEPSRPTQEPLYMPDTINSLAFSPDGSLLAASVAGYYNLGQGSLWLWQAETGERLAIEREAGVPLQVRFSPDGTMLASIDRGETYARGGEGLVLRDPRTLAPLRVLKMTEGSPDYSESFVDLAFHPQPGRHLIAAAGNKLAELGRGAGALVTVWNVDGGAGQLLAEPEGATCVAYSPDGVLLATGNREGVIRLWDVDNGTILANLQEDTNPIWRLAFSPDGRTLASYDAGGALRLWARP